ncbi:MAG: endo alpha-1,4 polygalactosaminidase [Hyphomicrobiaceae bacterium]|nr:endo alpha-1,4 polygalactosaminidase [Hyphomicrobiaceae bacterium]
MKRDVRKVAYLLVAAIAAAALPLGAAHASRTMVKAARTWSYQLQGDVGRIAHSNTDLVVVDPDHAGGAARFRTKAAGGRRPVLAYLSIGEAERGRPYWNSCCASGHPSWLTGRTQGWAGNYVVRFWEPAWKSIVATRVRSFLAQGYDGLYLDRVDTYENISAPDGSRTAMIALVQQVASQARALKGDAAIVVQNAEELLTSDSYLAAIDGIAKEDLLHGANHSGNRNPGGMVQSSIALLNRAKARGKAIFVVEYLSGGAASRVADEIRRLGYVPSFAGRSLSY